jgi:hypothetical protein
MLSRRDVIMTATAAPFLLARGKSPERGHVEFVQERHSLMEESSRGFRDLLKESNSPRTKVIIAAGARKMQSAVGRDLLQRVRSGWTLIFESGLCFSSQGDCDAQARMLLEVFGWRILPRGAAGIDYVHYSWPLEQQVRTFAAVIPLVCREGEAIATWRGIPVCARQRIGRGCAIYLGSMLGTGLFAGEREALALGRALLEEARA